MSMTLHDPNAPRGIKDGDTCRVVGGTHKGKTGIVRDLNVSKSGHLTITVMQDDGVRFKTLARNVVPMSTGPS